MADTIKSLTVKFNVNMGTDESGDVKTKSVSAGSTILASNYNANDGDAKVLSISEALSPLYSRGIYNTQKTTTVILSRS